MRRLFDSVVPDGGQYQLVAAYTEDVKRFNYGLVHGSKTTYGSLIVGWKEGGGPRWWSLPTVPDLSRLRRSGNLPPIPAVKRPIRISTPRTPSSSTPDGRHYLAINTFEWLQDEKLFIYVDQTDRKSRPLRLSSRPVTPRSEERVPCRFPGAGRCRPAGPGDSVAAGTPLVCTGGDGEGC